MTATRRAEPSPIVARWERPPQALDVLAQFRAVYAVEALDALPLPDLATPAAAPIRVLAQCLGRLFTLPALAVRALWCRHQASVRGRQALLVEDRLRALAFLGAEASRLGHWARWAELEERMGRERRYWAFLRRSQREWRRRG